MAILFNIFTTNIGIPLGIPSSFLNQFYRISKTKDIASVANTIEQYKNDADIADIIDRAAMNKSVCVEIVNEKANTLYSSMYFGKGCVSSKQESLSYKKTLLKVINIDKLMNSLILCLIIVL